MLCPHCRNNIADGINSCPYCGASVPLPAPNNYNTYTPNNNYPPMPIYSNYVNQPENPAATSSLVLGIIAFVLSWWFPIVSIILGAIGIKKSNETIRLAEQGYNKRNMGVAGKILSIIGLVLNCIFTFIIIAFIVFAVIAGINDYSTTQAYQRKSLSSNSYSYNFDSYDSTSDKQINTIDTDNLYNCDCEVDYNRSDLLFSVV